MTLSRRSLLQTLTIGAGMSPVLRPFGRSFLPKAHAAEGGAPRRILFFENPNGLPNVASIAQWWFKPGATYADGVFGDAMKALEKHRDDMVFIQNLDMKLARFGTFKGTSDHNSAAIGLYTGAQEQAQPVPYWGKSRNASIDYHMSQKIGTMVTPKFPMLLPGVQAESWHTHDYNGNKVDHNINPYDLYAKLFSGLMTGNPAPDQAMLARLANRQSVLDHVAGDIASFKKLRLAADDRQRADAQLQAIRTLEQRLSAGMGPAKLACSAPSITPQLEWKDGVSRHVPELMEIMGDMVVAALACDMTRIVHWMNWGRDYHLATCQFAPVNTTQGWHSLSHQDPNVEAFKRAKTWMGTVIAKLVDKLKAIPEGSGTMLDNTLVVVGQEHGWDHNEWALQWVTIGGKNLGVKVGNYIKCGEPREGAGLEHNRFLVSLLNVMGLPEETWGEMDPGRGPLEGFAAG